jgi:hypothetical protein
MEVERAIGVYNEAVVQGWFLDVDSFLKASNIYSGTLHFIVPAAALLVLYSRFLTTTACSATRWPPPPPWR